MSTKPRTPQLAQLRADAQAILELTEGCASIQEALQRQVDAGQTVDYRPMRVRLSTTLMYLDVIVDQVAVAGHVISDDWLNIIFDVNQEMGWPLEQSVVNEMLDRHMKVILPRLKQRLEATDE